MWQIVESAVSSTAADGMLHTAIPATHTLFSGPQEPSEEPSEYCQECKSTRTFQETGHHFFKIKQPFQELRNLFNRGTISAEAVLSLEHYGSNATYQKVFIPLISQQFAINSEFKFIKEGMSYFCCGKLVPVLMYVKTAINIRSLANPFPFKVNKPK